MRGMTLIVKKVAQIMCGVIFLYGIYIVLHGHLTPGGGFAGGAIISGSFILLILAFGSEALNLKRQEEGTSITESGAILMFLIIGILGIVISACRMFLVNFLPKGIVGRLLSAGLIPVYNIFIGIEVAAALLTIFLALVIYREEAIK